MDERDNVTGPAPLAGPVEGERSGWSVPRPERIPGDTYTPAVMAVGITFMAWGLVTTLIISGVGAVLFAFSLASWIGEARRDSAN